MIERAFINYKLTGNDEVFRQQMGLQTGCVTCFLLQKKSRKLM